jgi:hypothetical protein
MTDTPNLEWEHWQVAWRSESPADARATGRTAELQRRLRRHRRLAWAYTVLDVLAASALFAIAAYFVFRSPTLPVLVWSISVFVFTAIALGGAIWSRRDALPPRRTPRRTSSPRCGCGSTAASACRGSSCGSPPRRWGSASRSTRSGRRSGSAARPGSTARSRWCWPCGGGGIAAG